MYGTLGHTASDHIPTLGFTLNTHSCRLAQPHPVILVVQGELLYECTGKTMVLTLFDVLEIKI